MNSTQDLTWRAVEYAETCGLVVRGADCGCPTDGCYASVNHVPLTLRPTELDRTTFDLISKLQLIINRLIHAAANDHEFIKSTLSELIKVDEFWQRLYHVWEESRESKSPGWLGLHRSDYLIENNKAKMVEFNTIASSMGGHAVGISKMHRSIGTADKSQPPNNVIRSLSTGMKQAVDLFCSSFNLSHSDVCVIVLCEEGTSRNFSDQKRVELELQEELNYEVDIYRASLSAFDNLKPDENGVLKYRGKEIALFYLRAGYDPSCYECNNCSRLSDQSPTDQSWVNRLNIEKSRAIKSPPINYHLLTNKLFQAEFAKKSVLTRYMTESEADYFLETACHIDDLSDLNSPMVLEAQKNPDNYCLKILREGGALGNLFGDEIVPKLAEMKENAEISKMYILMEKINPNVIENTLVRCGIHNTMETISEVGIFGVYLFEKSTSKVIVNSNDGHLVRTKPAVSNVGGVNVGGACIGSITFSE